MFICPMGLLWVCYHFCHKPATCHAFLRSEKTGDLILFLGGISQFSLLLVSPETPDTLAILLLAMPITTLCWKMGQILSPKHSPTVQRDTTMTLSHMQPLRGQVQIK